MRTGERRGFPVFRYGMEFDFYYLQYNENQIMKKTILFIACSFLSQIAWAGLRVTANVQSAANTGCCYTLWVSVDEVDGNGNPIFHRVHGYVRLGCCTGGVTLNASTDNIGCVDIYFNGEAFLTSNDSPECLTDYIRKDEVYPNYTIARDKAISNWKERSQ